MVGPLEKVALLFRLTTRKRSGDRTTTMRRGGVGAAWGHLLLNCPASEPLWRAIFGTTFSIFDLWFRPWAWLDCWVSVEFLHAPIPQEWWVAAPSTVTTMQTYRNSKICAQNSATGWYHCSKTAKYRGLQSIFEIWYTRAQ